MEMKRNTHTQYQSINHELLKRKRNDLGLTRRQISELTDIPMVTLARWEAGEQIPRASNSTFQSLLGILELSLTDVFLLPSGTTGEEHIYRLDYFTEEECSFLSDLLSHKGTKYDEELTAHIVNKLETAQESLQSREPLPLAQ